MPNLGSALKAVGTGALYVTAKIHGGAETVATHHDNVPKFEQSVDRIPARLQPLLNGKSATGRKLLYDYDSLPYCNEVYRNSNGLTRGQLDGTRNFFGRKTCEGPSVPYCDQRLENGERYARAYPGNACSSNNGDYSGYGSGVGYRGSSGYGYGFGKKK